MSEAEVDVWEAVASAAERCADRVTTDPESFAEVTGKAFGRLKRSQKDEMARDWFGDLVRNMMRSRTLNAEREASDASPPASSGHDSASCVEAGCVEPGCHFQSCVDDDCTDPWCVRAAERRDAAQKRSVAFRDKINGIVSDYVEELKVEWTAELLASVFALSDGSLVTWGEATVDQHRERVEMFTMNAQANMEGAARHLKAIEHIEQSDSVNLMTAARENA